MSAPRLLSPTTTSGGTPVGGSGTPGTIPVWSGSGTTLGDSILKQSGTFVGFNLGANAPLQELQTVVPNTGGVPVVADWLATFAANGDRRSGFGFNFSAVQADNKLVCFVSNGTTTGQTAVWTADGSGNVGIGTASPKARGDVSGTSASQSDWGLLFVNSNDAFGADKGGSVSFGGLYQAGTVTHWAQVSGRKENGTSGQYGGYLAFATRTNGAGTNAERMRIDSTGNVGIGTASPNAILSVYQASSPTISIWNSSNYTRLSTNVHDFYVDAGLGGSAGAVIFRRSSSATESMRIDANGVLTMAGNGTASAPIIANSTGVSGLYFPSATTAAIAANGAIAATFSKVAGAGVALGGTTGLIFDASGTQQGLKLPATPGNPDTQTLDCYQEVTNWVPTVTFGTGGTVSYTVHTGYYVRVGRLVTFALRVDFTVTAAPTGGDLQITLPVASAVDQYFGSGNFNSLPGSGTQGPLYVSVGVSSTANIRKASATGGSSIASAITASSTFIVTGTYIS